MSNEPNSKDYENLSKQITTIMYISLANVVILLAIGGVLYSTVLPKVERAVQSAERVEERVQQLADQLQPIMEAGSDKMVEAITKMDAEKLSEKATKSSETLIDAATEKAKRLLNKDE